MTEILLLVIIVMLYYGLFGKKKKVVATTTVKETLSMFKDNYCEIVLKTAMYMIDVPYSAKGIIKDYDDEWVLITEEKKNKKLERIIKISLIEEIKLIQK